MATNRLLKVDFTGNLDAKYSRTDILDGNPAGQRADVTYKTLRRNFNNGRGGSFKVDGMYSQRRHLINNVLVIDIDAGLTNSWGDVLAFDSIKFLIIHNLETAGRYLDVRFKDERYHIGPEGYRVICEPQGRGIDPIISSSSSEEGGLIISTDSDVTFDLIIIGSSQESSSSSGL